MAISRWMTWFSVSFPNLRSEEFTVVEPPSEQYNCIAYAAGDTSQWWAHIPGSYWPPHATRSASVASLREAFAGLGYEQCDDSRVEDGYQKVALYETEGVWTHAAMQVPNGAWRSKMGEGPLIEHRSPESLAGGPYGNVHCFMRRPL